MKHFGYLKTSTFLITRDSNDLGGQCREASFPKNWKPALKFQIWLHHIRCEANKWLLWSTSRMSFPSLGLVALFLGSWDIISCTSEVMPSPFSARFHCHHGLLLGLIIYITSPLSSSRPKFRLGHRYSMPLSICHHLSFIIYQIFWGACFYTYFSLTFHYTILNAGRGNLWSSVGIRVLRSFEYWYYECKKPTSKLVEWIIIRNTQLLGGEGSVVY